MTAHRPQPSGAAFSIMPTNPKKKLCPANKVIVLGAGGVGKTTLVRRLAAKHSPSAFECAPALMGDYLERVAIVDGEKQFLKLQLWDTAGQGSFGSASALPRAYFRHARAAVLVYDATCRRSFDALLSTWLAPIRELYSGCAFSLALVATHAERAEARQVSTAQGEWLAAALGADHFVECSASSAEAADECFRAVARSIAAGSTWSLAAAAVTAALEQLRATTAIAAAAATPDAHAHAAVCVSPPSPIAVPTCASRVAATATTAVAAAATAMAMATTTTTTAATTTVATLAAAAHSIGGAATVPATRTRTAPSAAAPVVATTASLPTRAFESEAAPESETELESEPESESESEPVLPSERERKRERECEREPRKLRSPSVLALASDARGSGPSQTWTQLLQVHSAERKLLVGSAALLLATPVLLLVLLLLALGGGGGIGDAGGVGGGGVGVGFGAAAAGEWLERLGAACSSLVASSGGAV